MNTWPEAFAFVGMIAGMVVIFALFVWFVANSD